MTTEEQIIYELQQINQKLDKVSGTSRVIRREFMAGFFRSLGYTLATTLILFVSVYYLSKTDFTKAAQNYMQKLMPKMEISVPFALPSLDQP
jgi:hypothetical protein